MVYFYLKSHLSKTINAQQLHKEPFRLVLCSDKGSVFRWGRAPCAAKSPKNSASPPYHATLQLVSSFCCFPQFTCSLAHHSSPESAAAGLYVHYPFPLFISWASGLPPHFHVCPVSQGEKFQAASHDTQLAIGCGARCLHFPLCPFVVRYHKAKSNDSPLWLDLPFLYMIANRSRLCNVFTAT